MDLIDSTHLMLLCLNLSGAELILIHVALSWLHMFCLHNEREKNVTWETFSLF